MSDLSFAWTMPAGTSAVRNSRRYLKSLQWLQIGCCRLAGSAIRNHIVAQLLAFLKTIETGTLNRWNVNKHIRRAVFRLDETKTLGGVEKLYRTMCHLKSFQCANWRQGPPEWPHWLTKLKGRHRENSTQRIFKTNPMNHHIDWMNKNSNRLIKIKNAPIGQIHATHWFHENINQNYFMIL